MEQRPLIPWGESPLDPIVDAFRSVPDPRSKHRKEFPLPALLAAAFVAVLAGQTGFEAWERWLKRHEGRLPFFRLRRVPKESCWRRLFKKLDPQAIRVSLERLLGPAPDVTVAHADGKTLRAARDDQGRAPHHLAVYSAELGRALLEHPVSGKTSEPLELEKSLAALHERYPNLKWLTGDALFAQRPLCAEMGRQGLDYLFKLKKTNRS